MFEVFHKKDQKNSEDVVMEENRESAVNNGETYVAKAIASIQQSFEKTDVKYRVFTTSGARTVISVKVNGTQSVFEYLFIPVEKGGITVVSHQFVKCTPEKRGAILEIINQCNSQYRFAQFFLDKDNDVSVQTDVPGTVPAEALGPVSVDLLLILTRIMNTSYPLFMKALWA